MNESFAENPYATPAPNQNLPEAVFQRDEQGITLEFELNQHDLMKLSHGHVKTHPQWRRTYLMGWFRTTAVFALIGVGLGLVTQAPYAATPAFIAALACGVLYPFLYRRRVKRGLKYMDSHGRNLGLLGGRRMHFNPRGMYLHNEAGEFLYYWPAIELVVEYLGSVHIYVTSSTAMVIPEQAFDSDSQRQEFLAAIEAMRSGGTAMVVTE